MKKIGGRLRKLPLMEVPLYCCYLGEGDHSVSFIHSPIGKVICGGLENQQPSLTEQSIFKIRNIYSEFS